MHYLCMSYSFSKDLPKHKHCHFVEVPCGDKTVFIYKRTAVWLLQEAERISTDRLFRVRCKQLSLQNVN